MPHDQELTEVKVEGRNVNGTRSRENEFVYVNSAYVGSVNNVNAPQNERTPAQPITGVYREQYWACSRWPYTQRVLAVAVGVLLGALIGLALSIILNKDEDHSVIGPIFQFSTVQK